MADLSTIADIGLSAFGGINPIFGNIYAGFKNAEATKQKDQMINDYSTEMETWKNNAMNRDFLDTSAASSIMTALKQNQQQQALQREKQAAATGATDESKIAAQSASQQGYNDVVSRLAAMGTARQNEVEGRYLSMKPNIMGLKTGMLDQKIEAAQNQQANSAEAMSSIMSIIGMAL